MNRAMQKIFILYISLITVGLAGMFSSSVMAEPGDSEKGLQIYKKRCTACHGNEGDGLGPAAERLNPPPRDFTSGMYKIKTTGFDDMVPNDDDLFRMIRDGMPGTAMPGWDDLLSKQDIWNVLAYIKTFSGYDEEKPSQQIDFGTQVSSSDDSIKKGKALFHDGDRCSECHGENGKGNAIKRLKGENGERTWPRNLTKPWTFRGSSEQKDIYARISTGIPGTQMPAFADPVSKKKLSPEQRWHIANYVHSLAKTDEVVRPENTVIKADKIEGDVADSPEDKRWAQTEPTTFFLVPQIIAKQRFFTPSNDTITVRAMYSKADIAFLLTWDDRTLSKPGNEDAEKISDPGIAQDAVAIQLPVIIPEGVEKPYFGMGDATHPVNIWHWQSGTTSQPEQIALANSKGFKDIEKRDAKAAGLGVKSQYHQGTWQVVIKRALIGSDADKDIHFSEGVFIPIAFAAWDGSNSEKGSKHTMTTWYWLLLKPAASSKPLIWALIVMLLIIVLQFWWQKNAKSN